MRLEEPDIVAVAGSTVIVLPCKRPFGITKLEKSLLAAAKQAEACAGRLGIPAISILAVSATRLTASPNPVSDGPEAFESIENMDAVVDQRLWVLANGLLTILPKIKRRNVTAVLLQAVFPGYVRNSTDRRFTFREKLLIVPVDEDRARDLGLPGMLSGIIPFY